MTTLRPRCARSRRSCWRERALRGCRLRQRGAPHPPSRPCAPKTAPSPCSPAGRARRPNRCVTSGARATWWTVGKTRSHDDDVDAVVIAVPNSSHHVIGIAAANAGKHVLVDKPMACTTADADAMIAAAGTNDVVLVPFHNTRFAPPFVAAQQFVASGRLGEITGFRAAFGHGGPQEWAPDAKWFFDAEVAGGGCLIDLGVHVVDLLRAVTGDDIVAVSAILGGRRGDVEADAQLLARLQRRRYREHSRELVVGHGTRSSTDRDRDARAPCISTTGRRSRSSTATANASGSRSPSQVSSPLAELLAAIAGQRAPAITAADGRAAVAIVQAAYRSAAHDSALMEVDLMSGTDPGKTLEAGFGNAIITPPTPVQLAGFIDDQPATEVHDDLEVRALFLRGEHGSVCLLVCDLLGLSPRFANPVRDAVAAALELDRAAVLTSCIHTHAGPEHDPRRPSPGLDHAGRLPRDVGRTLRCRRARGASCGRTGVVTRGAMAVAARALPQSPRPSLRPDLRGRRRDRRRRRAHRHDRQRLDPSGCARTRVSRGVERLGRLRSALRSNDAPAVPRSCCRVRSAT